MLLVALPSINLEFLKTLKGMVSIIRDPSQTESVFDIVDGMRHTEASKLAVEYIRSKPEVAQMIDERYLSPTPELDKLLQYPPESLGYAYASAMKAQNFDPEFYRKITVEDDLSYILLRLRQTHDVWHTVTGMSTDATGEIGLQAFSLAQTHMPLAIVLIAGGLLKTLKTPTELDRLLDRIAMGYHIGKKSKPFLAQKWEEGWDKPLAVWRSELGVEEMQEYTP